MGIVGLVKYKVKYKAEWSYNTPSYDCLDDWHEDNFEEIRIISGFELLEDFKRLLDNDEMFEFNVEGNTYYFGHFCPHTGETTDYWYEILEEVKDERD